MKTIVFDLEIQKCILPPVERCSEAELALAGEGRGVHGWEHAHTAGISSAVAYHVERDRYHLFGDRPEEHAALVNLIANADRVVGFNHWNFDYPLLCTATDTPLAELTDVDAAPGLRDIDLLQMIWRGVGQREFGRGCGLDAVTDATLGRKLGGKTGAGARAPELYQARRYGELLDYNLRDVDLTERLRRFIVAHGYCLTGKGVRIEPRHPMEWYPR